MNITTTTNNAAAPTPAARKPVTSRAELIRRLAAIGITDAGHTEERELRIGFNCYGHRGTRVVKSTRRAPLIDPWKRVSFLLDGCRVHHNATLVLSLSGTSINQMMIVVRRMHDLTGNPVRFEMVGKKINGSLVSGHVCDYNLNSLKSAA